MTDPTRKTSPGRRLLAVLAAGAGLATAGLALAATPLAAPPGHPTAAPNAASAPAKKPVKKPVAVKRIDINSASRNELKTLPNIGDAEADKIIAGRPFLTNAEIVTKAGLPAGVYVAIKGRIVAMPKTRPKAKSSS